MARRADTQARRANRLPRSGSNNLRSTYDLAAGICHLCGNRVAVSESSRDHILPVSAGGRDTQNNYALGHKGCNTARGDLPLGIAQAALGKWRLDNPGRQITQALAAALLSVELKDWRRRRLYEREAHQPRLRLDDA